MILFSIGRTKHGINEKLYLVEVQVYLIRKGSLKLLRPNVNIVYINISEELSLSLIFNLEVQCTCMILLTEMFKQISEPDSE